MPLPAGRPGTASGRAEILALTGMLAREVRSLAAMSIERSNGASPASR